MFEGSPAGQSAAIGAHISGARLLSPVRLPAAARCIAACLRARLSVAVGHRTGRRRQGNPDVP